MKKLVLVSITLFCSALITLHAQDTLPRFTATNAGNNRIIIGWTNTFEGIRQISIQRSFDSLSGYKTILTVPDPTTPQNGYVDTKAQNDRMFYRLYIMLDKGVYLFSDARRAIIDTTKPLVISNGFKDKMEKVNSNPVDSVIAPSFGLNTKPKPEVFTPSLHVYTTRDGYVRINLPDDITRRYNIKFFREDDTFLFELKDIIERDFKIDKSNFYQAGWFKFELFEDGKLKEKHRFYLQREF